MEKREVIFIPCGHVIACIQCVVPLAECFKCKEPLISTMRVYIHEEQINKNNTLGCSSSERSDRPINPMFCKVCHSKEMAVTFLPCRHIYACFECAKNMKECPVCSKIFFAILQISF